MATVLGSCLVICSTAGLAAWLYFGADVRKEELKLQGQQELATMTVTLITNAHIQQIRLLTAAYDQDRTGLVRFAATDYIPWRSALLDIATQIGTITINDVKLAAPVAKKVAKAANKIAKASRQSADKNLIEPLGR